MVDRKTCNDKIARLGLRFPVTAKEEEKAFVKLIREYNPDLCENSECATMHKPKAGEIMEAHQFWKENHEACNKIANDYANNINRIIQQMHPSFDFNTITDPVEQDNAAKHASVLEEALNFW